MNRLSPFHLAFPVDDLEAARTFFVGLLQCKQGRSSDHWIDFDLFGNQITCHLTQKMPPMPTNQVDGKAVPIFHFGAILPWATWHELRDRLRDASVPFLIEPYIRFQGEVGEQATMFLTDPAGNGLEFKSFREPTQIFAH